ncbi:MAG: sugar nucleotide-binding protein [Lachnospiraceae bacterium]|nr:sugar nucleotide-binding protein [Lachnospiraceae bacterium]
MQTALVGYTGFVGSNLAKTHEFTKLYNSKNIREAMGLAPDLLVYAGVRAEKFLANQEPGRDLASVQEAFSNIRGIRPQKLVLISTIDVFQRPVEVDEETPVEEKNLQPYGANRYRLEQQVREEYPDALIVRLPGLYGENLKKNFIYDLIHVIPSMLREEKYQELEIREKLPFPCYEKQDNGFYKCRKLDAREEEKLKEYFKRQDFSALHFTDSRSVFQFYPLSLLWGHIEKALALDLRLLHLATEPLEAGELYKELTGEEFVNHTTQTPALYDYRSRYAGELGGAGGYVLDREFLVEDIRRYVREENFRTALKCRDDPRPPG